MAQFTITIPDDKVSAVVDAFADQYKYQTTVDDGKGEVIPNPISKIQFAKNQINTFIKDVYVAVKVGELTITKQQTIDSANIDMEDVEVS